MHGEETRPLASRAHEAVTGVHREVGAGWVFELSQGWLQQSQISDAFRQAFVNPIFFPDSKCDKGSLQRNEENYKGGCAKLLAPLLELPTSNKREEGLLS